MIINQNISFSWYQNLFLNIAKFEKLEKCKKKQKMIKIKYFLKSCLLVFLPSEIWEFQKQSKAHIGFKRLEGNHHYIKEKINSNKWKSQKEKIVVSPSQSYLQHDTKEQNFAKKLKFLWIFPNHSLSTFFLLLRMLKTFQKLGYSCRKKLMGGVEGEGASNYGILSATMIGRQRKFFVSNCLKVLEKVYICKIRVMQTRVNS